MVFLIWLIPDNLPPGSLKSIFDLDPDSLHEIKFKDDEQNYIISRKLQKGNTTTKLWEARVYDTSSKNARLKQQFSIGTSGESMFNDLAYMTYKYKLEDIQEKLKEYGLHECNTLIRFRATGLRDTICIGNDNYSSTRTYILSKSSNQVYIVQNYPINRFKSSIYERIEKRMYPYEDSVIDRVSIRFSMKIKKGYPNFFKKIGSKSEFQMVTKEPEKNGPKNKVWEIKNAIDIPSKQVTQIFHSLKAMYFSAIVERSSDLSNKTPILEVDFFNKASSKDELEKIMGYRLWDEPYPRNTVFIPKKEKPNREDALAVADGQIGVYSLSQLEILKTHFKNIDSFLKNIHGSRASRPKTKEETESSENP